MTRERTDLRDTARFLHSVFGVEKFRDPRYLEWFYRQNPDGEAVEIEWRDASDIVAHVAGIPQVYHSRTRVFASVFPLNLSVGAAARGRGLMTKVSEACFDEWLQVHGDGIIVGMPNAASTPGYTGRLGCRLVGPLPVVICPPVWPDLSPVVSVDATPEWRNGPDFDALAASLDFAPTERLSQRYSSDVLRWRLAAPNARYAVHAGKHAVVVSTVSSVRGVPVAVIVKTFRRGTSARATMNGAIAAACRHHRAPFAVYAGSSASCRVVGLTVPERFKPAPLNFITRSARLGFVDDRTLEYDAFEFFNFDAF